MQQIWHSVQLIVSNEDNSIVADSAVDMVEDRDAEVVIMQNIISSEVPHQPHHI